jgi:fumarate reductase subunit C
VSSEVVGRELVGREAVAQARRWALQRLSALVLLACVLVHLLVIVYATRGGLSGAEILARTRGHRGFAAFYTVFVLAVVVHVPLGLATIAREWARLSPQVAWRLAQAVALLLLATGLRAVWAVFGAGA